MRSFPHLSEGGRLMLLHLLSKVLCQPFTHLGVFIRDLICSPAAAGDFLDHQLSEEMKKQEENKGK